MWIAVLGSVKIFPYLEATGLGVFNRLLSPKNFTSFHRRVVCTQIAALQHAFLQADLFTLQFSRENASIQKYFKKSSIMESPRRPSLADAPPARIALGDSSELAAFAA